MTFAEFRTYCLSKGGALEEQPLGNGSYYYKVKGLVFAIADTADEYRLTLKCDPMDGIQQRQNYGFIKPGYHINKEHWNTILMKDFRGSYNIAKAIEEAYGLTLRKLNKKQRAELGLELA